MENLLEYFKEEAYEAFLMEDLAKTYNDVLENQTAIFEAMDSYVELMKVVNDEGEIGEEPVVNSRYSIVLATAKRARQIIAGAKPLIDDPVCNKPLSIAVEELYRGEVKIVPGEDEN